MTIKIFFLTKMSDWNNDRNHIVIKYNEKELISEQLAYISFKKRIKFCRLLKLDFWSSVKFCTNYYTRQPIYRHYRLLWQSEDITESIPFLQIMCRPYEYDQFGNKTSDSILDVLAKIL